MGREDYEERRSPTVGKSQLGCFAPRIRPASVAPTALAFLVDSRSSLVFRKMFHQKRAEWAYPRRAEDAVLASQRRIPRQVRQGLDSQNDLLRRSQFRLPGTNSLLPRFLLPCLLLPCLLLPALLRNLLL